MLQGGLIWEARSEAAQLLHVRGTDIWECSIRQKGSKAPVGGASVSAAMQQEPPHHQQQAPWQAPHTPASHIGGEWFNPYLSRMLVQQDVQEIRASHASP